MDIDNLDVIVPIISQIIWSSKYQTLGQRPCSKSLRHCMNIQRHCKYKQNNTIVSTDQYRVDIMDFKLQMEQKV